MNIYKITEDKNHNTYVAYFINKEEAEKYVAENNKPWTNMYGITWDTVTMETIEVGKFEFLR